MAKASDVNKEVKAMGQVASALAVLDQDECKRVLRWAADKFKVQEIAKVETRRELVGTAAVSSDEQLSEVYGRAAPKNQPERVLVVAYWLQVVKGNSDVEAQAVNDELKDLGHGVNSITHVFDNLKGRKPQLMVQIQKSGKTRQARKRYRVTDAGKKFVQKMLSEVSNEE